MSLNDRPVDPRLTPLCAFDLTDIGDELCMEPPYQNGKNSRVLVRSPELSTVLTALKAGSELKPHQAPTTASVLVLRGELSFATHGEAAAVHNLTAGHSVVFHASVLHSVKAITDCLFVITMGAR